MEDEPIPEGLFDEGGADDEEQEGGDAAGREAADGRARCLATPGPAVAVGQREVGDAVDEGVVFRDLGIQDAVLPDNL